MNMSSHLRWWQWRQEEKKRSRPALVLVVVGGISVAFILFLLVLSQFSGWVAASGVGGLVVFAGMSAGGFLGFLFSVPRIMTKDNQVAIVAAPGDPDFPATRLAGKGERLLSSNTNLERVSEWLTTMLVGVGLTQIGSLDDRFVDFSGFLESNMPASLSKATTLPAIGPFLLVSGLVAGFIFFYLYTRIYLSPLFQYAERVLQSEPGEMRLQVGVPKVREAAARLAEKAGGPSLAYTSTASEISIDDSLDVIFSLLYREGGYAEAIDIGNTLAETPAANLARYWYLMAAAYGQKHHELVGEGAATRELRQARNAVLSAARRAVQLNHNYKFRLLELTDPESDDNDLQDFVADKDFQQIVK
ncbi:hypothetical protein FZ934_07670 [Rhizobium grahamii]|uniref:Uncharacterized protein n=1 Tax=Rhizobium grahamii TaxID=1120045 RepID=A0A5Q0C8K7_9HYPH|nr:MULTISPECIES: hypothetical protein [Rhizobium]QFY60320.1 hypothetical protein FZ934_07670 [Rhizobium grahamii]QRM50553.1 hypothetical protein F3Y33_15215 [Rhizobium sp. BG6]